MAVDFKSGYVPPGVYVSSDVAQAVGAVGITATVLCLVGEGVGYRTYTEYISFPTSGDPVTLTQTGIVLPPGGDPQMPVTTGGVTVDNAIFKVSAVISGTDTRFAQTTNWSLSQTGGVTTISRVGSAIPTGSSTTVKITYRYVDASYTGLNVFADYATFTDVYGEAFDALGEIQSPLSLAAQYAFQNGANLVYAIAVAGGSGLPAQFTAAYQTTLANYDINLVVPLWDDAVDLGGAQAQLTALRAHLSAAESASLPRVAIVGLPAGFQGTTPDVVARFADSERIVLTWPNILLASNPITRSTVPIDGYYFAAGAAGVLANQNVNRGLTRTQVRSFTGLPAAVAQAQVLPSTRNAWSAAGVSVAEIDRLGRLVVRHGVTTDVSAINTREISIVRCRDALFSTIYQSLDQADMIGDPIVDETPLQVKGIVSSALEQALAADVIASYADLAVRQQSLPTGDPTVIEVRFRYLPTYPLNYITVVFTIDLTTGSVLATDTATAA